VNSPQEDVAPAIELPSTWLPIVDDLSDGVFVLDPQGLIVSWSAGAERITGMESGEAVGKSISVLQSPECQTLAKACDLLRDPAGSDGMRWQECRIRSADGRVVQLLSNLRLVRDRKGAVLGAVGSLSDLTSWVLGGGATLLDTPVDPEDELDGLVGRGQLMRDVFRRLRAAAACDVPVLVCGEPGTGRSHAARLVHSLSRRSTGPLEVVECGGRDEAELESELFAQDGRILAARGGTLLLEQVHELPPALQGRLLDLSRHGLVRRPDDRLGDQLADVRVVATSTEDLDERVSRGEFLAELRDALRGIEVLMPPLRQRRIDIPLILRKLVEAHARSRGLDVREISRDALEALVQHPWPANVRQLETVVVRALEGVTSHRITLLHLPAEVRGLLAGPTGPPGGDRVWTSEERLERARLIEALERHHWNRTRTARELGISRVTLWKRIRRLGIEAGPEE
jgi:PAS domain S-box-containing protein